MAWSTAQLARISGVTSRALRHYDAVGLLRPAWTGAGGLRFYTAQELLRLQQILLLRELDLGLDEIAAVLDRQEPALEVLQRHRRALETSRQRTERLIATVEATIADLEGDGQMRPEQWFDGFDAAKQEEYDAEARQRWGDQAVDDSWRTVRGMSKEQVESLNTLARDTNAALADLMAASVPVDDERVLDAVAGHYRWVSAFWTPDAEAYTGLGRMYVDDPRFAAHYDGVADGLAVYLRDAIEVYARTRLAPAGS